MALTKYEELVEDKLILVEGWARDGLSEAQISKNLGIAYSTFKEYKKKHLALSAALKKGKEVVDFEVENALLNNALKKGDTTAQIFWLKNRKPDKFREKKETTELDLMKAKLEIEKEKLALEKKKVEAQLKALDVDSDIEYEVIEDEEEVDNEESKEESKT